MTQSGHIVFRNIKEIIFGKPVDNAIDDIVSRVGAERILLMASGTLRRETDEVEKICKVLGNRCAGIFDKMPPHTPREAVIAATEQARKANADLIVTLGGGSVTDGAKGVQLCLANDITTAPGMDALRPVQGPDGTMIPAPLKPPTNGQKRRNFASIL